MAVFPSYLYKLTPRDEQVTGVELLQYYSAIVSSAATIVDTGVSATGAYTVPKGRVLCVTGYCIEVVPGAAQNTRWMSLMTSTNNNQGIALNSIPVSRKLISSVAAGTTGTGDAFGPIYVPEGGTVSAKAEFSGALANSVQLFFTGILMPRGNIAI